MTQKNKNKNSKKNKKNLGRNQLIFFNLKKIQYYIKKYINSIVLLYDKINYIRIY